MTVERTSAARRGVGRPFVILSEAKNLVASNTVR